MDEGKLEEIEARANEATAGPWEVDGMDAGHSRYEMNVWITAGESGDTICDMDGLSRSRNEKVAQDDGYKDACFIAHARTDVPELVAEVRRLRGRLDAVCGVLSDAAAYGEDVDPGKVLEAVRGAHKARLTEIGFAEIVTGDFIRVSFPPRGGMSDNWTITHSREGIAFYVQGAEWRTSDGQTLVSKVAHDHAKIELLARL